MNKKRVRWIKRFKSWHKWPAIIISFLSVLFAVSGIVLNHRPLFSKVDLSRQFMPSGYTYQNWNLDAVKGSLEWSSDSMFVYGKTGILLTNKEFNFFKEFNDGFPKGIDNRSITAMAKAKNAEVVAGTLDGLFRLTNTKGWEKLNLPVENNRITDLSNKGDTLLVLTRDYLLKSVDLNHFDKIQLPAPINHKKQTSWFKLLWNLHSGELFGFLGKLFVDLLGVVVILLSITGLVHFFYPKLLNAEQRKNTTHRNTRKLNLKWHNIVGYVFVVFLMFNVIAGMFLRPPLLIAIAKAKVGVIPFTHLDSPNPWQDKLRKITWNQAIEKYVVSTSDGFYLLNENQQIIEKPNCMQPPVSVMGCNVLQQVDSTNYIVGSFSGLFSWDIVSGEIYDLGKNKPFVNSTKSGRPISGTMVSGIVYLNNANIWYSDYNKGMVQVTSKQRFVKMPKSVKNAPMSLWNFCLEVHTGRIFESILGGFYILYVPLAGICMLIVLISGFFLWYWVYRLQKKKQ